MEIIINHEWDISDPQKDPKKLIMIIFQAWW